MPKPIAKYPDQPRFKLIYEYEGKIKKDFQKLSMDIVKQIGIDMLHIINNQK